MARKPQFRQRDLVRAIKAAQATHAEIQCVRILPSGEIEIIFGKPEVVTPCPPPQNPWDAP